jgi:hypothetical protein
VVTIGTDGLSPEEIALKIANEQQITVGRVPRISVALPAGSPPARRSGDPGGVRQGGGGANSGAIGDDDNAAGRRLGADPRRHGSAGHDHNAEHGR